MGKILKLKDDLIEIKGKLSARDAIYRILNSATIRFKKKGFVDVRFPFEIWQTLNHILIDGEIHIENLKYLGFDLKDASRKGNNEK